MRTQFCLLALLLLFAATLNSCSIAQAVASGKDDVSNYAYASVLDGEANKIPAEMLEYEPQLFEAVAASGLEMVNCMRINEITPEQQSKLLLVKFGIGVERPDPTDPNYTKLLVTVIFNDYLTGRPVASFTGSSTGIFGNGTLYISETIDAIKAKIISKFHPSAPEQSLPQQPEPAP